MYCSLRQYESDPSQVAEMMHIADEHFADQVSDQPGFVEYHLVDCGDGQIFSLTLFADRESAERSNEMAAEFIRDKLAGFEINRTNVSTGEVAVNRARSEVLEAVHA